MKSSSDDLDGRYGADRYRDVEAVLYNSFEKCNLHATTVPAQIIAPQHVNNRSLDHILE